MYFVFTPNKVFVQFQLDEYFGNSAELNIIFTPKNRFSIIKFAEKKKKQKREDNGEKIKVKKIRPRKLDAFFENKSETRREDASTLKIQEHVPFQTNKKDFNLIPINLDGNEGFNDTKKEELEMNDEHFTRSSYLQGYHGKYLPATILLEEQGEIHSPYTAGLLHELYLADFNVFMMLEEFGMKKSRGFTIKTLFLSLYYLYFVPCNSYERLACLNSEEFSILINCLAKPSPDTLRKFLKQQVTPELAFTFSNFIYFEINHLDPMMGIAAYLDEHFIPYQGTMKMAKGKSGGKNKVEKGFYRFYLTCGLFSLPLFSLSKDGSKRLENVIFEVLETYQEVNKRKIHLVVFDRGIKSFETLKKLHATGYHFICWSFHYNTVKQALKRRHRLKMDKISDAMRDLIRMHASSSKNVKSSGVLAKLREFFERLLPVSELEENLRHVEKKENGVKKWNGRDFIRSRDIQIEFDGYGSLRTIILEKKNGEKIAIFTSIPPDLAHPIEILMVLKKKQLIENFFSYKIAIQGDYIPFWDLQEAEVQKTSFHNELKKPSPKNLEKFQKRARRLKQDLKKLSLKNRTWKKLFKKGELSKKTVKKLEKEAAQARKKKEAELKEMNAFLTWGRKNKSPIYFDQFEPVMELNPRIEVFLNALNDLFFVNSRRIASDWGNSLTLAKISGEITLSDGKIKEISKYTPEKLNDIFLKGGGKVLLNPANDLEIIAELHTELLHKSEVLIIPYLKFLNKLLTDHEYCYDTSYSLKFTHYLLSLPKLVKVV